MPKDINKASFKDMYKDDKARIPIVKYFKEFLDNYDKEEKPKGIKAAEGCGADPVYAGADSGAVLYVFCRNPV